MPQYEKIHVSKGIDINKSNTSKECMIFHYWYFKDIGYKSVIGINKLVINVMIYQ